MRSSGMRNRPPRKKKIGNLEGYARTGGGGWGGGGAWLQVKLNHA